MKTNSKSDYETDAETSHITDQAIRRILAYLIPLRILRGHLPSRELLHRFPLVAEIYNPFIDALKKSDIKEYDSAIYKWEKRLLDLNVGLVIERARELVMRGLFRRVLVQHLFSFFLRCH